MARFGGMSPFPRRFGGGRSTLQVCLETLCADRGDALDASNWASTVYVENMAVARALAAAWQTNTRLGNLWDAQRMPLDILARWEKILVLTPSANDTIVARRARVGNAMARFGRPAINGPLSDALRSACGPAFVGVEYISTANATINVPDGTYPFGTTGSDVPWSSTVATVLVRLQKPNGWTEGQFYAAAGKVADVLDPELPGWCTFRWYRPGPTSTAIAGGPSAAGFFVDDPANVDNEVFSS